MAARDYTTRRQSIVNALVNALEEFGVSHIEMPATPESLWGIINSKQ